MKVFCYHSEACRTRVSSSCLPVAQLETVANRGLSNRCWNVYNRMLCEGKERDSHTRQTNLTNVFRRALKAALALTSLQVGTVL